MTQDEIGSLVEQLVSGWSEHIEYAEKIRLHTFDCFTPRHCRCPALIERRARTVRHPGLVAQLRGAGTLDPPRTDGNSGGSTGNKPKSRPPGNAQPLLLLDEITRAARDHHDTLREESQLQAITRPLPVTHVLTALPPLVAAAGPDYARETRKALRSWVRQARFVLGYDRPTTQLRNTVCGDCGGALAVAIDASTDVRCVGSPDAPPCGTVYPRWQWVELLADPEGSAA